VNTAALPNTALQLAADRLDQRGSLRMQEPGSRWREVDSRWIESSSLCWDGICARGDIPLD
jgi:hypothetical protein